MGRSVTLLVARMCTLSYQKLRTDPVADCNEKTATIEIQKPKPVCPPSNVVQSARGCALCARDTGVYAPCAALYAGGRGGWALFAGGVGDAGGDALCATLYAGGCGG